jgi:hypothetical protein
MGAADGTSSDVVYTRKGTTEIPNPKAKNVDVWDMQPALSRRMLLPTLRQDNTSSNGSKKMFWGKGNPGTEPPNLTLCCDFSLHTDILQCENRKCNRDP